VNTQNITLRLPSDALKKAKVAAANRGTSLSALLSQKLQEAVGEDAQYEAARKRAFKSLDAGWPLGGATATRNQTRG
jgi:hypothetical protein